MIDIKQLKEEDIIYENHIWGLTGGHKEGYQLFVSLHIKLLQMELETGAIISVILEHQWKQLFGDKVPYSGPLLQGYAGHQ